jgi:hypothetical protein
MDTIEEAEIRDLAKEWEEDVMEVLDRWDSEMEQLLADLRRIAAPSVRT